MKTIKDAAAAIEQLNDKLESFGELFQTYERVMEEWANTVRTQVETQQESIRELTGRVASLESQIQLLIAGAQLFSPRQVNQGKTHDRITVHSSPNAKHCKNCGQTKVWGRKGCPTSECLRHNLRSMEVA